MQTPKSFTVDSKILAGSRKRSQPSINIRELQKSHLNPIYVYSKNEIERKFVFRLRVTCDDTHLHFIHGHQFIDSPEWESNHEQSDDVFQVTITAEEDCVYLCWPRMRLERVLRHRPTVKVVLDSIIGKH